MGVIDSYGIIAFHISMETKEPKFLLYQRRDTFEYIEFVRGLWINEKQLPGMFSLMSAEERQRIREYTLRELWNDLWVNQNFEAYVALGFSKAQKKYDQIKHKLSSYLNDTQTYIIETHWGFPKGKKNPKETAIEAATREFEEETKLSKTKLIIDNFQPFTELFKGTNRKMYGTYYYLAEYRSLTEDLPPMKETPMGIRKQTVSEEAYVVKWFSFAEACRKLDVRRQNILRQALHVISQLI